MSYMPLASFLRASGEQPSNTAKSSRECAESHASETHLPALSTSAPRSDISDPGEHLYRKPAFALLR